MHITMVYLNFKEKMVHRNMSLVVCLSPEAAPYRSVAGEPPAGAPLVAASLPYFCPVRVS